LVKATTSVVPPDNVLVKGTTSVVPPGGPINTGL
jgi:hypothetical protein